MLLNSSEKFGKSARCCCVPLLSHIWRGEKSSARMVAGELAFTVAPAMTLPAVPVELLLAALAGAGN